MNPNRRRYRRSNGRTGIWLYGLRDNSMLSTITNYYQSPYKRRKDEAARSNQDDYASWS